MKPLLFTALMVALFTLPSCTKNEKTTQTSNDKADEPAGAASAPVGSKPATAALEGEDTAAAASGGAGHDNASATIIGIPTEQVPDGYTRDFHAVLVPVLQTAESQRQSAACDKAGDIVTNTEGIRDDPVPPEAGGSPTKWLERARELAKAANELSSACAEPAQERVPAALEQVTRAYEQLLAQRRK